MMLTSHGCHCSCTQRRSECIVNHAIAEKAHGKIGDVDAFDHLTDTFRRILPISRPICRPEILFMLTERVADAGQFPRWAEAFATPLDGLKTLTKAS